MNNQLNQPAQPPQPGTITMADLLARIPELTRRRSQAKSLRGTADHFKEVGQREGLGNYVPTQHGGLYQTVAQRQYDWKKAGNEIVGAAGQMYYGPKATEAEQANEQFTNEQILQAAQQMSGGGEDATKQTLRQYLGLLGGSGSDLAKLPHVSSTQTTTDGKLYTIMSDGTPVDTGLTSNYNTQIKEDGNGGLIAIGTSGAGRGQAAPVMAGGHAAGGQPAPAPATNQIPEGAPIGNQAVDASGNPVTFGDDVPQEVRRMIIADPNAGSVNPPPMALGALQNNPDAPGQPAPVSTPAPGPQGSASGTPVRVATPAEQEAAKVIARTNAEASVAATAADTAGQVKLSQDTAAAQAEARANLGKARTASENVIGALSGLRNSRGLKSIVGSSLWARVPDGITNIALPIFQAGTPAADALAKFNELRGANFMQAFETLKGGGQITEQEGAKAEAAYARLQRSQTYEEFMSALDELEQFAKDAVAKAEAAAAGNFTQQPAPAPAPANNFRLPSGWSVEVK